MGDASRALRRLQQVLERQAKDEGLRFEPIHASEAYVQGALSALTKAAKAAVAAALETER